MSNEDASFADGAPASAKGLSLRADDTDSLAVISALMQDAVGKTTDIAWMPKRRIFALVANRFRWEDVDAAKADARPFERRRVGLHFGNVLSVKGAGFDPAKAQQAFELLSITFEAGEDGTGTLSLICAGGAGFALEVEALDLHMSDLEAVWHTQIMPEHDGDDA